MIDTKILQVVRKIQLIENNFIYNTNISLLNLFIEYIKNNLPPYVIDLFLNQFDNRESFKIANIENIFFKTIYDNFNIDLKNLKQYNNKSGIYFLYYKGEIVYIGYSSNLRKRAIQSYICKLPYGVDYMKLMTFDSLTVVSEIFENILIEIIKPVYNQSCKTLDTWDINKKMNITNCILKDMELKPKISYNFNLLFEGDMDLFDDVDLCF